jgi:hypothetical protein
VVSTSATSGYANIYVYGITSGKTYYITFHSKATVGTTQSINLINATPSLGFPSLSDTTWTKREYTVIATSTSIRFLIYSTRSGNIGDTLLIDNFSVLELD